MVLNIVYPKFITRHYGLAFYHGDGKKVIVPADSFFMGRVLVEEPQSLMQMLAAWLDYKKTQELQDMKKEEQIFGYESRWDGGIFNLDEHYQLEIEGKRKKRRLIDLTPKQLFDELVRKSKGVDKTTKIITASGKDVFRHPVKESKRRWLGNIGNGIELTGKVLSKGDAREWDRKSYHDVKLVGVMAPNRAKFQTVDCECKSTEYNSYKQIVAHGDGYTELEVVCLHQAALLNYAYDHPYDIDKYRQVHAKGDRWIFWRPFHAGKIILQKHAAGEAVRDTLFDKVTVETLIARYIGGMTLEQISQSLMQQDYIWDDQTRNLISKGKVGFESVVQYQKPTAGTLAASAMQSIHECLSNAGFRLAGFVKEKKWTELETSCPNYINDKGEEARVVVREDMPPVVAFRRPIKKAEQEIFARYSSSINPFAYLFEPQEWFDDRIRKKTFLEYRIPWDMMMHPLVAQDYRRMIDLFHPDGLAGLRQKFRHKKDKPMYNAVLDVK